MFSYFQMVCVTEPHHRELNNSQEVNPAQFVKVGRKAQPKFHHMAYTYVHEDSPLAKHMRLRHQVRAASIRRLATCRRLRPANEEVATSLSLLRSTSSSDTARIIST